LFWRHGCSAARNSPACKGKSLRCLRKCRFAYIDTSPKFVGSFRKPLALLGHPQKKVLIKGVSLSRERAHLFGACAPIGGNAISVDEQHNSIRNNTAALRSSRLHLGCQTHQTCSLPRIISEPPPDGSTAEVLLIGSAQPNSKRLPGTTVAPYPQGTSYDGTWNRLEPNARRCVRRAGCEGEGRLHCEFEVKRQRLQLQAAVSLQAIDRHRRTRCRSGQNQRRRTLQQAIATRTCPLLTPIEYDYAYERRADDCAHRQRAYRMIPRGGKYGTHKRWIAAAKQKRA
jgi:hypothetical protein